MSSKSSPYIRIGNTVSSGSSMVTSRTVAIIAFLLLFAVAATGMGLGIAAVARQDNGFSTPSLDVQRLRVGVQEPLPPLKRKRSEEEPMSLVVSGSTSITGNLIVNGEVTRALTDCSGGQTTLVDQYKTATARYIRYNYYSWSVSKQLVSAPNVTILPNQCDFLMYHVETNRSLVSTYTEYLVEGVIVEKNGGAAATIGLNVTDTLLIKSACTSGGYVPVKTVVIDVSSNPVLDPNEIGTYAYSFKVNLTPEQVGCHFKNEATVTILNHGGHTQGCNGQCKDSPVPCPFGPTFRADGDLIFPTTPEIVEYNETAKINDIVTLPSNFTCLSEVPSGDVYIATDPACVFDSVTGIGFCDVIKQVCNAGAACDYYYPIVDYIRLMTVEETVSQVVNSNSVTVSAYSGPCSTGCSLTIGYWKTHAGFTGNNADRVTPFLPIRLGCPIATPYTKGVNVTSALQSTAILTFNALAGGAADGLNKVAAQLLAAKLNIANGASSTPVASTITSADNYLCQYGFNPGTWSTLSNSIKNAINGVASTLDQYNNGLLAGVPHC